MEPDEEMRRELFERSKGVCECRMPGRHHGDHRCPQVLKWEDHKQTWDLLNMHLSEDDSDPLNWLVLCSKCLRRWLAPNG